MRKIKLIMLTLILGIGLSSCQPDDFIQEDVCGYVIGYRGDYHLIETEDDIVEIYFGRNTIIGIGEYICAE